MCLPLDEAKEFLKNYEQFIQKTLEDKNLDEATLHSKLNCLEYLPEFFIDLYIKVSGREESFSI
jgi:hypothetical protein